MALTVAVTGIAIGLGLWVTGKLLVRLGEALEKWGDRF